MIARSPHRRRRIIPTIDGNQSKEPAMKSIGAIVSGVIVVVAAATANGQERNAVLSSTAHATQAPYYFSGGVEQSDRQSPAPLFTIGGFGVHAWAPVEPPYDADADRNLAADPRWAAG
jgi:hypothetical protein